MLSSKILLDFFRVFQWYKNVVIFLPLVFSLNFLNANQLIVTLLGFIALCLVSSAGYIRNDLKDIKSDKLHPKKKLRPLPSGQVTTKQAKITFLVLIVTGLGLSFALDWKFGIVSALLMLSMEIYSRWLKNIIFLDILSISGNFILRALGGIVLIGTGISPWLILGVFFVALFLAVNKRHKEVKLLKETAEDHRNVLSEYSVSTLQSLILISAILIITTYSLYTMNSVTDDWRLVITVPIVVYMVFRMVHLSSVNVEKISSDNILKDKATAIAALIYIIITLILIYAVPSELFGN